MTEKTAIVLLNLGGPLQEADIRPFLFNFFMDKNIIGAPLPIRFLLAKWISHSRGRGAARTAYARLGFKSPLLQNTQDQAAALQQELSDMNAKVFVAMRYWHPLASAVVRDVKNYNPDHVFLLPLYPQFSTTTVFSSLENWDTQARAAGLRVPTQRLCCYPVNDGFITASAKNIRAVLQNAPVKTRLLFSAHGLPEKVIAGGDPYQYQCEKTAEAIVQKLALPGLDWQICYQSRVGPLKWIGPSTEEALKNAAADGVGVAIYPHAFVSEHVETLVEIEEEYRHQAKNSGIPFYARVPAVGTHPDFISGLAGLVRNGLKQNELKRGQEKFCPNTFKRCFCATNNS